MQSQRFRILCTEDHPDTCELIRLVLSHHNCDVITAETSLQAIDLAQAESFDLYLLDNWIPGMSGTDLCKALRVVDSETPILFYSGAAYPKDKAEAYASGAQGYLVKPADNDELISEVLRLISEHRHRSSPEVVSQLSFQQATA
ncbi:MAG TPA: response regulator [Pyrinomonadaceae bacterium]|nr:response regulator [Pyrinomonadaceae bacterium]